MPDAQTRCTLLGATGGMFVPEKLPPYLEPSRTPDPVGYFLRSLHPTGYRELRAFHADKSQGREARQKNFAAEDIDSAKRFAAVQCAAKLDVYVGVAARRGARGGRLEALLERATDQAH